MKKLQHKFVEFMPRELEDGILYVSIRFRIASHNCCCGCGNEVVTNLSRNGWQLIYDGESVSLYPSIGNWDFQCRSHYWIIQDEVQWAERWSDKKIKRIKSLEAKIGTNSESDYKNRSKAKIKTGFWNKIKSCL